MIQRRTMKVGDKYEIQERYCDGDWAPVCEFDTLDDVKQFLKNLRVLEGEADEQ